MRASHGTGAWRRIREEWSDFLLASREVDN